MQVRIDNYSHELCQIYHVLDVQYSLWSGFCYMTPLVGGYVADTYLGRYKTILIFCIVYLGGLVMVVASSVPGHVSEAVFFPAIYIIAIGTGVKLYEHYNRIFQRISSRISYIYYHFHVFIHMKL